MTTQLTLDLPGTMHAPRLENSPGMQRIIRLLLDREKYTTLEIIQRCAVCAVNSYMAALNKNGNGIDYECDHKHPARYWLTDKGLAAARAKIAEIDKYHAMPKRKSCCKTLCKNFALKGSAV